MSVLTVFFLSSRPPPSFNHLLTADFPCCCVKATGTLQLCGTQFNLCSLWFVADSGKAVKCFIDLSGLLCMFHLFSTICRVGSEHVVPVGALGAPFWSIDIVSVTYFFPPVSRKVIQWLCASKLFSSIWNSNGYSILYIRPLQRSLSWI